MYEMEGDLAWSGAGLAGWPAVWHRGPPPGPDIRATRRLPGASRVPESPPDDVRFQR